MVFKRNAWIGILLVICGISLICTTPKHYDVVEANAEERDGGEIKKVAVIGYITKDSGGVGTHYRTLLSILRSKHLDMEFKLIEVTKSDMFASTAAKFGGQYQELAEITLCTASPNQYIQQILDCDAVYIVDAMPCLRVMSSIYAFKKHHIPYVISAHCSSLAIANAIMPILSNMLESILFAFYQYCFRHASIIFPAAEWLARDIQRDFAFDADKVVVKSNGFDPHIFNTDLGNEYHALHNYLENDLKLPKPWNFCISRISPEKNLPEFFKMDIPGSKIMVGRGPLLDRYRREYPNVTFLGFKAGRELAACYQNADVCVYTSFSEVLPCVSIESIACGTPIATFNANGFSDVVINDINGYLVDPMHPEDFPAAVAKAMQLDREKVAASVHNNPKYDWNEIANVFYDNLVYIPKSVRERARAKLQYENSFAGRIDNATSWMMWFNPIMWPLGMIIYCAQSNSYN